MIALKNILSLEWIVQIDPCMTRGNPISSSTSFDRDNETGNKMKEVWKDVVGYEGYYQCSNMGNIRSIDRLIVNNGVLGSKKNCFMRGRTLTPGKDTKGYAFVNLCKGGVQKSLSVHRIIATAFIPNVNNKPQINHIDYNPLNNYIANLEWVTQSENIQHSIEAIKLIKRFRNNIGQFKSKNHE